MEIDFISYILSLTFQITSRKASKSYMKMVDNSYFGSSDEVKFLYSFANYNKGETNYSFLKPLKL